MTEQELRDLIASIGKHAADQQALATLLKHAVDALELVKPEEPPTPDRSIFGLNLGETSYWEGCRPWNNHAHGGIVNVERNAVLSAEGYLTDGTGIAWIDTSRMQPGIWHNYDGTTMMIDEGSSKVIAQPIRSGLDLRLAHGHDMLEEAVDDTSPTFRSRYSRASVIRLMDVLVTNSADERHVNGCYYRAWPVNRAGNDELRVHRMISPYHAIQLAADTGADLWWNFHHRDSPTWIEQQCESLLIAMDTWDCHPTIFVEDANERWNPGMPAWQSARAQIANDRQLHASHHAARTRAIAEIARRVFGTEKVVVVVSCQNADVSWAKKVLEFDPKCDALAVSAYWGNLSAQEYLGDFSVDHLLDYANTYQRSTTRMRTLQHRDLARQHNLRLVGYEGGVHFQQDARQKPHEANIRAALADPRMGQQYREFGLWWKENIADVLCWYNDVSVKTFGSKRLEHDPDTTPRMAAILELMQ